MGRTRVCRGRWLNGVPRVVAASSLGALRHVGWARAIGFCAETTLGLQELHKANIFHRDLKSLNLLVTQEWHVKLADFGLSRFNTSDNMDTMKQMRGTLASRQLPLTSFSCRLPWDPIRLMGPPLVSDTSSSRCGSSGSFRASDPPVSPLRPPFSRL